MLDERMAERLRNEAARERKTNLEARERFLQHLRVARQRGATVREIAEVTGFSFQRIAQLVKDNES